MGTFILVLALAVGCTTDTDDDTGLTDGDDVVTEEDLDPTTEEEEVKPAEDILADFGDKIEESLSEAGDFINKNMEKLSEIEVDEMVSKLMIKTEEGIDNVRQKIQDIDVDNELNETFDGELYLSQDQIDRLDNDELREELIRLQSENYRLINLEGEYYPAVNYEGFKKYEEHVSDELREYIDLKTRDADKPVALDAAIYISYDELADRIVATENYIKQYGEGDRYGEAINMYRNKLSMYLLGLPNTPITESDSDKIRADLMESYKETALIKDSSTGFIVGKYINLIDQNQGIIDDEILAQGQMLIEEATELIGTGK